MILINALNIAVLGPETVAFTGKVTRALPNVNSVSLSLYTFSVCRAINVFFSCSRDVFANCYRQLLEAAGFFTVNSRKPLFVFQTYKTG